MTEGHGSFVYVTYIRTTAEALWEALTSPAFMKKYWFDMHIETDWTVGSAWRLMFPDGRVADGGRVVAFDRPHRIELTWRNELRPELTAEGYASCVMALDALDTGVRLTVTHTIDRPESKLIEAVSGGWPRILSNLKSLLETGEIVSNLTSRPETVPH